MTRLRLQRKINLWVYFANIPAKRDLVDMHKHPAERYLVSFYSNLGNFMRIVLFGPPASGKGTQAHLLHEQFGYPHLSTGDLLRATAKEDSTWGEMVRAVPVGRFASDELIIDLLKHELSKPHYEKGVILDGFPRTQAQAEKMAEMGLLMDIAIELRVDETALLERIVNRRVHPSSGRIYNLLTHPPKQAGLDDETGEALVHREDDKAEVVCKRLEDFKMKTSPAIDAFRRSAQVIWLRLDGMREPSEIYADIQQGLKSAKLMKETVPNATGTLIFEGTHPVLMNENASQDHIKKPKF